MSQKYSKITRRSFLGCSAAAVLGLTANKLFGGGISSVSEVGGKNAKKRNIRFAHFADIHIEQGKSAPQGFTAALRHAHNLRDKPDMLITGGDHIMDSMWADNKTTGELWALFRDVMEKECKLPVKYCIGNHDCWGLNKKGSKTTGKEKNWGVKRAVEELGLPNRYYSFDYGKWRFIVLDSTVPSGTYCIGKIDDEQFAWLENEIKSAGDKFISVFTHIPIMSAAAYFYGDFEKTGDWIVPGSRMIINARKLKDLFWHHKNVKLCVSGHIHLADYVVYDDVHYICNGAICGKWWDGPHQETEEGYGLFDLYDDGTFDYQYVDYGWQAKES